MCYSRFQQLRLCCVVAHLLWLILPATSLASDPTDGEKLFALKLKSLFAEKCLACHGGDEEDIQGGFDLRSRESVLKGGDSFEQGVVNLGHGDESFLYLVTTRKEAGYEMPPKEAESLSEEQAWWIRDWIDAGAPWPSDERIQEIQDAYAEGVQVATSGGLDDGWTNRRYEEEKLWAYRPLKFSQPPSDTHPVDWFIDRKLEDAGLTPAPPSDAKSLARRMSFGLTGLPPVAIVDADRFGSDYEKDPARAMENFVDRLQESEHYGEQFAQHWLDVARYADSAGFANDYARPNAWRYRDYVARAFNTDKPYNEFVREQLAGDEIDPADPEMRIATGFLRMGPWEQTSMSVFRVTRVQWLDDVTDSVGQTFLGHAMQCAKCHDHKFDPVSTRDYYGMMAVFSTTQFAELNAPFLPYENRDGFDAAQSWTQAKIDAYQTQAAELKTKIETLKTTESGDAKVGENGLDPGDENSLARMNKNIARHRWELDKTKPIAFSVYTGATVERKNVGSRLLKPKQPWEKGYIEEDTILAGGDVYSRGDTVSPGALSAAESLGEMPQLEFASERGKRRLALANWIVHPKNPLAARVMVNRVWAWHFGKGLAGNPNNFGGTGKLPTHPELLDFLANWFMQNDWSFKRLNRLILTSQTYRRSSIHPEIADVQTRDPLNRLYAFMEPRRLGAEAIRDAMLAASGELNLSVGGIPCRPDLNMEVATQPRQIMGGTASVYEPDAKPERRNRRTLYAEKIRGLRDPFLETFNQPGPDKSCELRETSIVAPQALTLFNAVEVHERALAMAKHLLDTSSSSKASVSDHTTSNALDRSIVEQAFLRALHRKPSPSEAEACVTHWRDSTKVEATKKYKASEPPTEIKRTVMAEKTGEPYDFIEKLPGYENYEPDLQPHEVDARTRGLAQVCLVLLNSNEFSYLD
ncbi:MAG: PSD1 and planctomycete cytochrome C domain-containing protein [Planctomycetota bacterium]